MTFSLSAAAQNPGMAASAALSMGSSALGGGGSGATPTNYGLVMRFRVTLTGLGQSLGDWTSCTGLGVTFEHETYEEGGMYEHARQLPGKMKYGDVTLERPITSDSATTVLAWLKDVRDNWVNGDATSYTRSSARIDLFGIATSGPTGPVQTVATWNLSEVLPVSWSGPSLDANQNKVATEKLVLRHQGFFEDGS